ncbi:TPA: lipoate--protein ligase family protein [Thermoplasmata archaeon]|nr:lipoate--protein ligase family protein [Thermoplasmata archaeon]
MIFVYTCVSEHAWRLVDSGPLPTAESAAADEAILGAHAEGVVPDTLHFYTRSEPTISIGYFQRVSEAVDLDECARRGVRLVRRRSGGSTIFTDSGQMIYAVVMPASAIGSGEASFGAVCGPIARALGRFGADARHRPVNDIEIGGRKVSGSAQLRSRGSVLQHGTVLIDTDIEAMDAVLKGGSVRPSERITDLAAVLDDPPSMDEVKAAVTDEIARSFGISFEKGSLTEIERHRIAELVSSRYGSDDWNRRI